MTRRLSIILKTTTLPVLALSVLAGCQGGGLPFGGTGSQGAAAATAQSVQLVERDVEAPDVFQTNEKGLWDGRPSLGGVWVAHPDVIDPERVIIRNLSNGKFVIGALFRRERENPGPALQVSSDAAAALEMLAGAPVDLQVVALRREEVAEPTNAAVVDFDAPSDVATSTLDPVENAAPAVQATEATVAKAAPAPASSALTKPFIQLGIFSVEANATRTADQMRGAGIVPTVKQQTSQGRTFWRVIVGPAATETDRADLLAKVKGMGFADAYAVTN